MFTIEITPENWRLQFLLGYHVSIYLVTIQYPNLFGYDTVSQFMDTQ